MNAEWVQARCGLAFLPPPHHPDCTICCAQGACHFCLNRPGDGGTLEKDGWIFLACRAHIEFFANHQVQANAGLDMTEGLAGVTIHIAPIFR